MSLKQPKTAAQINTEQQNIQRLTRLSFHSVYLDVNHQQNPYFIASLIKPQTVFLKFCCLFLLVFCGSPIVSVYGQKLNQEVFIDSMRTEIASVDGYDKIPNMIKFFDAVFPKNMALSEQLCREMENIAVGQEADSKLLEILSRKGHIYNYQGKFDSMRLYVSKGLALAIALDNEEHQGDYLNSMGMIQDRTGTTDSAIYYYEAALKFKVDKLRVHNNLGRIYSRQGNMTNAIKYFELAMKEAKEKKILNAEAVIANNIGSCYIEFGDLKKGIDHFNRSIKLKEEIGDERGKLFAMTNLIDVVDSMSTKKRLAAEGIRIAEKIGHEELKLGFIMHLGRIAMQEGYYQKSLDLLLPATEAALENPGMHSQAILNTISKLYIKLGRFDEAEKYGLQSFELANKYNSTYEMQAARIILLQVYEAQTDHTKYFNTAIPFYLIRDSIDQNERIEKLAKLEDALDQEQKDKVELLNLSIQQKEKSRYWIALSGILSVLMLTLLLYFRNKRIKAQRLTIKQEHEAAIQSELLNDKLKELNSLKSKLYVNVTHEFRTPLTVILGMSEQLLNDEALLSMKGSSSSIKQKLKSIYRNGDNLMTLVNKMLDLSKLENNTLKIDYVQGNIVRQIRYLCESFHSLFETREITFELNSEHAEILMDYDVEKIRQIITNLISNAIKYASKGGVIKVNLDRRKSNTRISENELILEVIDDGAGISSESIPHVFDRFYQADDKIAKSGGTGIGLALTKELAQLLKGTITVDSQLGLGSKFTVVLPITQNAALIDNIETKIPIGNSTDRKTTILDFIPSEKKSLLIIEDNLDVAEFISSCLDTEYDVHVTHDGSSGIAKALEIIPDIIISDVMMPEKDGFEVCQTLKTNELTSHIPIILLTAKSDQRSRLEGLETGADDYLLKPFDNQELQIRVRKLVELRVALKKQFGQTSFLVDTELKSNSIEHLFIKKACASVVSHLADGQFGVDMFSKELGISKAHLNRKLNALTDMSANKFIQSIRLQHAYEMLKHKTGNVSEVAFDTGFNSVSYFIKCFREKYKKTPNSLLDE